MNFTQESFKRARKDHNRIRRILAHMSVTPFAKLASCRYFNTLHGFEHGNGAFVMALTPENMNVSRIKERLETETGASGLIFDDFIGHHYIAIPDDQRDRIPTVLNALLAMMEVKLLPDVPPRPLDVKEGMLYQGTFVGGFDVIKSSKSEFFPLIVTPEGHVFNSEPFHPYLRLQTRLKSKYVGGSTFSIVASEYAYVEEQEALFESMRGMNPRFKYSDLFEVCWTHAREELWKTEKGKSMARRLMEGDRWASNEFVRGPSDFRPDGLITRLVRPNPELLQNPALDYPLCTYTSAPEEPQSAPTEEPQSAPTEEGIRECMVCLDRPPDTLVLPCMHCVVCRECSDGLKSTNDARTCLRCRCPIEDIVYDEE